MYRRPAIEVDGYDCAKPDRAFAVHCMHLFYDNFQKKFELEVGYR
jgi:hypothetical protein